MEVIASSEVAPERLLPIDEDRDAACLPLPDDVRALARFVAAYYQEPIGLCLRADASAVGRRTTRRSCRSRHGVTTAQRMH